MTHPLVRKHKSGPFHVEEVKEDLKVRKDFVCAVPVS